MPRLRKHKAEPKKTPATTETAPVREGGPAVSYVNTPTLKQSRAAKS